MKKAFVPSLAMLGFMLGSYFIESYLISPSGIIKLLVFLLGFAVLFLLVRDYLKKTLTGSGSFGELFKYGFFIILISSVIASVYLFIHLKFIDDHILRVNADALEQAKDVMSEKQDVPAEVDKVLDVMNTPGVISFMFLIGNLFQGTIYSLISAAIQKNSKPQTFGDL